MTDYVRDAIARRLGVSKHAIRLWRLTAGQGSCGEVSRGRIFHAPGMLEAGLEIKLDLTYTQLGKLRQAYSNDQTSFRIGIVEVRDQMGERMVDVDVALFYGKETQHFFKALLQNFTVRGPQKRKKK